MAPALGFLGFYIARPEARGKGYGIQIWDAGMARLAGRNVGLDGVVAQQAQLQEVGFPARPGTTSATKARRRPMRSRRPASPWSMPAAVPFDLIAAYDRRFFPEARDSFLAPWIGLPERAGLVAMKDGAVQGFAVIRACRAASRIGPLYAASPEIAACAGRRAGGEDRRHRPWRSTCPTATSPP